MTLSQVLRRRPTTREARRARRRASRRCKATLDAVTQHKRPLRVSREDRQSRSDAPSHDRRERAGKGNLPPCGGTAVMSSVGCAACSAARGARRRAPPPSATVHVLSRCDAARSLARNTPGTTTRPLPELSRRPAPDAIRAESRLARSLPKSCDAARLERNARNRES